MSTSSPFQLQTEAQRKLHQQLMNTLGHGPAALYSDAVRLLAEASPYTCTTHLIAHLLREIESSLRRVLLPYNYPPSAECPHCHHKPETDGHKKQIQTIAAIYSLNNGISRKWVELATGSDENEHGFAAFAHRDALTLPRPLDNACQQMMTSFEEVVFAVLDAFERQSLRIYEFLDELLVKSQPGVKDVSKLKNKIPANWATYSYFFSRLEDPAWLRPLGQKNGCTIPPEVLVEGQLRYSLWPQAIYLKKMATKGQEVQKQVLDILIAVATTTNPYAQQDMLEIAQLLPPQFSVQLTPFVCKWIAEPGRHALVSETLQQFIVHLVQGGQASPALALFENVLLSMTTNTSYLERWDYEQLLFNPLPAFIQNAPREILALLCKLLDQNIYQEYIRFRKLDTEDAAFYDRAREANTTLWLPTFEANEHMHIQGTQSLVLLAIALRKATEQTIKDGYLSLSETLSLIEPYKGKIFKRLTLYLLSQFASPDSPLARSWLMTRSLFDDADLCHEYSLLAQVVLPHFTEGEQTTWFEWIETGPDLEAYTQRYHSMYQELPTNDNIQQYKAVWQRDWLGRIEKALPDEWCAIYEQLVAQYGKYEPESPLISWPPETSISLQDACQNMTVAQWLEKLNSSPDNQGDIPRDALLSFLASLIPEAPEYFASQAHLFEGQPPDAVKTVLRGLIHAVETEHTFGWDQVIHLCLWIMEQRIPSGEAENSGNSYNPAWSEASSEVARLFLTAFEKVPSSMPYTSSNIIWQLLVTLVSDPSYQSQAKEETTPQRSFYDAINSTRGIALLAVISYAWWVMKHWKEEQGETAVWDLSCTPEVQELLEQQLSGRGSRSPIVHAVYSRSLLWLAQLDEQWTIEHLKDIFPHHVEDSVYYEAAWTTYLFQPRLTHRVFTLAKDEYVFALERLQPADDQEINRDTANFYLARHLIIAYWNGNITLEDTKDNMLSLFFRRASGTLRRSFITQVGEICEREENPVDPQIIERFQRLWEWRVTDIKQSPLGLETKRELAAFSWWVTCDAFPTIWAIEHLDYVLTHVDSIERSSLVVYRLTECIAKEPLITLRCLSRLVRGTTIYWGNKEWKTTETLLATALQPEHQELHAIAKEIISYLSMHGHTDLLKLLPQTESAPDLDRDIGRKRTEE